MLNLKPYRVEQERLFNPFREFDELERGFFSNNDLGALKTDIREEDDKYVLEADLPGFKKEDIHVDLEDDRLSISAERHSEAEQKDLKGGYVRRERCFGTFTRSFDVSGVCQDDIKASFENGVLRLVLPKQEEKLPFARHLIIE